ncbi:uncharacterized protein LOC113237973 [Hyposmocoma kahamanoa]|uniref:uncharacterized protein LOC113237973 n=1 Tax=Hyposmocoma kahamanoa TaxID=1477025 RepID=UPI000E6D9927|nr:uncharacterized protein LOC113237973 [Hyposmocoma kahamanoa]
MAFPGILVRGLGIDFPHRSPLSTWKELRTPPPLHTEVGHTAPSSSLRLSNLLTDLLANGAPATIARSCEGERRLVKTAKGATLLLLNGYTYSKNSTVRGGGTRYACSNMISKCCRAFVHMTKDNFIIKAQTVHNHDPPRYHIAKDVRFVKSGNGKKLLLYNSYTFSKRGHNTRNIIGYGCSKRISCGCPAKLTLNSNGDLRSIDNIKHNHEPSQHMITPDGRYVTL